MKHVVLKGLQALNIGGVNDTISSLSASKEYFYNELQATKTLKKDLTQEVENLKSKTKSLKEANDNLVLENNGLREEIVSLNNKIDSIFSSLNAKEEATKECRELIYNYICSELNSIGEITFNSYVSDLYNIGKIVDFDGKEELTIVKKYIKGDIIDYFNSYEMHINIDDLSYRDLIFYYEQMNFSKLLTSYVDGECVIREFSSPRENEKYHYYRDVVERELINSMLKKEPSIFMPKVLEITSRQLV